MGRTSLVNQLSSEIALADNLPDIKIITDKAQAFAYTAQKAGASTETIRLGIETYLRAAKKGGEMLAEIERSKGGRPTQNSSLSDEFSYSQLLKENNLHYQVADRWQKLAEMEETAFEKYLAMTKRKVGRLTLGGILRTYQDKNRKIPDLIQQFSIDIRHGDFREVLNDITSQSVKLILTDPPYGKHYLSLWSDLGIFAAKVLRPDGALITYSGQLYLPEVIDALKEHLDWWWLCGLTHEGQGNLTPLGQPVRKVINQFKPVLIFVTKKGGLDVIFQDLIHGHGKNKDMHNWQQPPSEASVILKTFCKKGDLIVDPFAGSGSIGQAASELGLNFIGAEILEIGR